MFLPTAKRFGEGDVPNLPIPKGPGEGFDLALIEGVTPQVLGRTASNKLWTSEELKNHMMLPKGKCRKNVEPRTDFSPTRKETFKGNWLTI